MRRVAKQIPAFLCALMMLVSGAGDAGLRALAVSGDGTH